MANFSALKTAIQNAIKQNGNEEITGDVLQQILLSIVSTMGDGAINTIEQNLSNETTTRQGADTQLQNAINAIKANIDNGYVYAGIATPSTVPVSGKVFYISTTAGTYTNFGGQVLTQGINILRFNGSAWSNQQLIGIDDVPIPASNSLIKSGGVQNELALGAVYDVSAKNPTGGPNNDGKWGSLSALLSDANLNTLIPTAYRKGGMSIKFVQSSDNKYVQYRLMSDTFNTTPANWQGVDEEPAAGSKNLVESGGVKSSTIEEKVHETSVGEDGKYYITDHNKVVLGYIEPATGAMTWLQKNNEQLNTADIVERASSEIDVEGYDGYKFITDNDMTVVGYIDTNGGVYFYNLLNQGGQSKSDDVTFIMNAVANGGRNQRVINMLNHLTPGRYTTSGNGYQTSAFMTFHDDDTLEPQIPVSCVPNATPSTRVPEYNLKLSGFASFLYPFMRSITERHKLGKRLVPNEQTHGYDLEDAVTPQPIKGSLVYGLAAEGQRIGLIGSLGSDIDSFDGELNLCGKIASKLHYKFGWDIMCHSMTARYIDYSYWVDSLEDPFVAQIEASATKNAPNAWKNSYIHCDDTNLDYEYRIDNNNHGEWHLVSDMYIRPYLAKSLDSNAPLYFNPRYSEVFQVEEWKKRASIAGLPFIDCGVSWGNSPCKRNFLTRLEYITNWFWANERNGLNHVPLNDTSFDRANIWPDGNNKWSDYKYNLLKRKVDEAIDTNSWLVFAGHIYETVECNYYLDNVDYGSRRCDSYSQEWIVPLNQEELESIDENNYWDNPPARLGISSWAEWYPCPGTTYDMLMNVIEYAIEQGMEFGSTEEGLRRFANIFNIGIKHATLSPADERLAASEKDSSLDNHIIQGSDGSIKYNVI